MERSKTKGKLFFGFPGWECMHSFASQIDTDDKARHFKILLKCYVYLFPCESCGRNLAYKLHHYPIDSYLHDWVDALFYTYMLHDLVNTSINKDIKNKDLPVKYSPPFDVIKQMYQPNTFTAHCSSLWKILHIFAATLRPDNAMWFKKLLICYANLLPTHFKFGELLEDYPCDAYLTNNHDAFFYTYLLHDIINQQIKKHSPRFDVTKAYYFDALSQECKECKV